MKKAATVEQEKKEVDELTKLFPDIEQIRAMKMVESAELGVQPFSSYDDYSDETTETDYPCLVVRVVDGLEHVEGDAYPQMEICIFPKDSPYRTIVGFRAVDGEKHYELRRPLRYFTAGGKEFYYPCIGRYRDDYVRVVKVSAKEALSVALECLQTILIYEEED